MATRLRITLEFNPDRKSDLELYNILMNYSSPTGYIKDVLRGLLPLPGETFIKKNDNNSNDLTDEEELMDF